MIRFCSFWIFPLLSIALLTVTHRREPQISISELFWLWPIGLAAWTIIEYVFHRFLLHSRYLGGAAHALHHESPRNPDKILVHPLYGVAASAAVFGILAAATGSPFRAAGIMMGIWTGFLYYEAVHYRVHMSLKNSPLLQRQRRAHFHHHFLKPDKCFGVTTSLWDNVAGTAREKPKS